MRLRNAAPLAIPAALFVCAKSSAAGIDAAKLDEFSHAIEPQVIACRRDIHEHPELSNREVRTSHSSPRI